VKIGGGKAKDSGVSGASGVSGVGTQQQQSQNGVLRGASGLVREGGELGPAHVYILRER
jgi:hypothetical protein